MEHGQNLTARESTVNSLNTQPLFRMKAFLLTRYGKTEKLQLTETATPALQADEVLIELHAAGVNQLDSKLRDGEFKLILP